MNANTRGTILVKCDRINDRIDDFSEFTKNLKSIKERGYITFEDFDEFVKSVHVIVTTELNDKGVERKWTKYFISQGEQKTESNEQGTHKFINCFKRLMTRLHLDK